MLTRRSLLRLAGMAALAPIAWPARAAARRFAVIDWAMLETALAIGAVPAAATELVQYRKLGLEPHVPGSVSDLGLRGAPNLELLHVIAPDLIVSSNFYEYRRASFERIAPVFAPPVHMAGKPPYALLEDATLKLGEQLGLEGNARALVTASEVEIEAAFRQFTSLGRRKAFIISLGDARHLRAFGRDSLFGDVLERVGMENAWKAATSYSAAAPVGLEELARVPDASIIVIGPTDRETLQHLPENALWNALPAIQENRVHFLPPIDHFGGLPAARHFVRLLREVWRRN